METMNPLYKKIVRRYISYDGFLCIFKRCSICNTDVLCKMDGKPETHTKECSVNQKLFKLSKLKREE